jgi:hypothetical protein
MTDEKPQMTITPQTSASQVDRLVMRYWYKTVKEMCPICGEEREYKYREYGEKPLSPGDRITFSYINHYCDV